MSPLSIAREIVAIICPAQGVYGSDADRERARAMVAELDPTSAAYVAALTQSKRLFSEEQSAEVRDAMRAWAEAEAALLATREANQSIAELADEDEVS